MYWERESLRGEFWEIDVGGREREVSYLASVSLGYLFRFSL